MAPTIDAVHREWLVKVDLQYFAKSFDHCRIVRWHNSNMIARLVSQSRSAYVEFNVQTTTITAFEKITIHNDWRQKRIFRIKWPLRKKKS